MTTAAAPKAATNTTVYGERNFIAAIIDAQGLDAVPKRPHSAQQVRLLRVEDLAELAEGL